MDLAGGNPLFAREVTISAVETFKHSVVPNIDSAFDAEVLHTFKTCSFPTFLRGICCLVLSYHSNLSFLVLIYPLFSLLFSSLLFSSLLFPTSSTSLFSSSDLSFLLCFFCSTGLRGSYPLSCHQHTPTTTPH